MRSFIEPDLFGPLCTVRQYHSDLSDQSAQEIRVRIRVRLKDALFWHFSRRIKKKSTFSSANFTEGNIAKKNTANN